MGKVRHPHGYCILDQLWFPSGGIAIVPTWVTKGYAFQSRNMAHQSNPKMKKVKSLSLSCCKPIGIDFRKKRTTSKDKAGEGKSYHSWLGVIHM